MAGDNPMKNTTRQP